MESGEVALVSWSAVSARVKMLDGASEINALAASWNAGYLPILLLSRGRMCAHLLTIFVSDC